MTTTDPQQPDPAAVFTRATWALLAYAARIGLRPEIGPVYQGAVRVRLNTEGVDGGFGRIEIGAPPAGRSTDQGRRRRAERGWRLRSGAPAWP